MLLKQARSANLKKWTAKHEYEELKEGVWLKPALCCEREHRMRSIETSFWKEAGCRKDFSTLVGQMKVSAKHVTRRKAQKSTGFTPLPRTVRGQTGDPTGFQKVGAKSENLKEGVGMAKRFCNAYTQ